MSQRALPTGPCVIDSAVRGVRLHVLREVKDARGDLCVAEVGPDLPFAVQRSFLVYNVPSAELRGAHAHRRCSQFLMAVKGSIHVIADDGARREAFVLDRPNLGLLLPPMEDIRKASAAVAVAVARRAREEGLGRLMEDDELVRAVGRAQWEPHFVPFRAG